MLILELALPLAVAVALAAVAWGGLYAGCDWGRFAALWALHHGATKWTAYLIALTAPLLLAALCALKPGLAAHARQVFFTIGAAALIGTCLRYHSGLEN